MLGSKHTMAGVIGFCGLGDMGAVIFPRLLAAGYDVVGWNRTPAEAEALLEAGMRWADTPRQVAAQSEVDFSIVTEGAAVKAVALGADGIISGLQKGAGYVDMSTISPGDSRAVSEEFVTAGLEMLDGPCRAARSPWPRVLRRSCTAAMRKPARAHPVLEAIGPKVTRIGEAGLACPMKIAANLLPMVEVIAFGEAVALTEKGGVAPPVALKAVLNSVAASSVLDYQGPYILEGEMPA